MSKDLKSQILAKKHIIDLRNENLKKDILIASTKSKRTASQGKDVSRGNRQIGEFCGASIRKLATEIYGTDQLKSFNKLKLRATSADPRFRRERSPARSTYERKSQCRSEVRTPCLINSTEQTKSESSLATCENNLKAVKLREKRESVVLITDSIPANEPQQEAMVSVPSTKEKAIVQEVAQNVVKDIQKVVQNVVKEDIQEVVQENVEKVYQEDLQKVVKENVQEVIEEGVQKVVVKEVLKEDIQENARENESTNLSHVTTEADFPHSSEVNTIKNIQKAWNESKLHSAFLKNVRQSLGKSVRNTFTLPMTKKESSTCNVCNGESNSLVVNTSKFDVYRDEDISSDHGSNYKRIEKRLIDCLLSPIYVVGSFLGLTLVATVIWIFAGDHFWDILMEQEKDARPNRFQTFFTCIAGYAVYGINSGVQKLFSLLSLQRNEFMKKTIEETEDSWFSFFYK